LTLGSLTVADFLKVDPSTGELTLGLATTNEDHLGTHTVRMLVESTGFDQTAVAAKGSAGKLPTLLYTFDVMVTMCALDVTSLILPPSSDLIAVVR